MRDHTGGNFPGYAAVLECIFFIVNCVYARYILDLNRLNKHQTVLEQRSAMKKIVKVGNKHISQGHYLVTIDISCLAIEVISS